MMLDEHVALFIFENQAQALWYMSFKLFHELILYDIFAIFEFFVWLGGKGFSPSGMSRPYPIQHDVG